MKSLIIALSSVLMLLTACNDNSKSSPILAAEPIAHLSVDVYKITDENTQQHRYEASITVKDSATVTIPIFFGHNGQLTLPEEALAQKILNDWIKTNARTIASQSILDAKTNAHFFVVSY